MKNDKIYPTMVIRSQEEVIKMLEEENTKLYKRIKELEDGFEASNKELSMVYNELSQKNKIIEEIKEALHNKQAVTNDGYMFSYYPEDMKKIFEKLEKGNENDK